MVAGRTTEPRTVTVTKTSASAAITAAAGTFAKGDVGSSITGTGIPAGATLAAVTSGTAATLSANATASGSGAVVLTPTAAGGSGAYGFRGWSPESDAENDAYTVAAVNAGTVPPDRVANAVTPAAPRRSRG